MAGAANIVIAFAPPKRNLVMASIHDTHGCPQEGTGETPIKVLYDLLGMRIRELEQP